MKSFRQVMTVLMGMVWLAACMVPASQAEPALTVYLVRHAEKLTGDDPGLTEAGAARAERIADIFEDVALSGVYSTDTKRTRATAAPSAEQAGLEIQIYDAGDMSPFAETLKAQSGVVLVVGHSNTIPTLAGLLTGRDEGGDLDESQYDVLYRIAFNRDGEPVSFLMSYDTLEASLAD